MVGRAFHSPFYVRCRGAGGEPWCKREQKHKEPHYVERHGPHYQLLKHPASGGPVPTVKLGAATGGAGGGGGAETSILAQFISEKSNILPRQTRDRRRKKLKQDVSAGVCVSETGTIAPANISSVKTAETSATRVS